MSRLGTFVLILQGQYTVGNCSNCRATKLVFPLDKYISILEESYITCSLIWIELTISVPTRLTPTPPNHLHLLIHNMYLYNCTIFWKSQINSIAEMLFYICEYLFARFQHLGQNSFRLFMCRYHKICFYLGKTNIIVKYYRMFCVCSGGQYWISIFPTEIIAASNFLDIYSFQVRVAKQKYLLSLFLYLFPLNLVSFYHWKFPSYYLLCLHKLSLSIYQTRR